ncbi:MAG: DUF362 domain-containing protein [Gemmataceae bacterium]
MSETPATQALIETACADGGWSYMPGQPPHLEPTCLALLAVAPERERHPEVVARALAWLQTCALPDGTYRLGRGRHEAVWPTAMVLFTLAELREPQEQLDRTARALLAYRGRPLDTRGEEDVNDIDGSLIGWPWAEGNFSWVEPTAWACLGLTRMGQGAHSRVVDGRRLLLDRTLETGGVNYGNRRIFGITLEPIPTPTALALLALQHQRQDERVQRSLEYLKAHAQHADDVEHLAWAILALNACGAEADSIAALQARMREAVTVRAATPYLAEAPLRLALLDLALQVPGRNPFKLAEQATATPLPPGKVELPSRPIGERVRSFFQGLALNAVTQLKTLDANAQVHIATASDYQADLVDVLSRQFAHFRERVPLKGKRVVLKPNLVEYHRDKVINTHPNVVAAVIELCQREGASEVIVAEGPGHWRNVEHLVRASGLGDVLRHFHVRFVDLNHDEPSRLVNLGRLTRLEHLYVARTVADADVLISLPKLKTHHWAVATLSLKNLFGTLPGICYGWPKNELHWRGIDNSIVDIAATRTPDLAIVDGIIGMEGDGPLNGTPKPMGVLIMGTDLVAVDATCCRLMQLDPTRVGYLVLANRQKVGHLAEAAIQQLGETIEARQQPFDTVPHFKQLWLGRGA